MSSITRAKEPVSLLLSLSLKNVSSFSSNSRMNIKVMQEQAQWWMARMSTERKSKIMRAKTKGKKAKAMKKDRKKSSNNT